MPSINPLLADTATPPIPEAQAWTRRYDGSRGPLIDLSQAVPGYPPHPDLLAPGLAARQARSAGYGAITGDADLREVYAAHVSALYGGPIDADEMAITAGCNQAFFVAMIALAKAGDAVLLPSPWYFNHEMTLHMLGIEARRCRAPGQAGFVPDPGDAERADRRRVSAIVLVTPNNPTGAVYPPERHRGASRNCAGGAGIWLVLDETYRDFMPSDGDAPHALFADPAWRDAVIGLYSFSKSYCIPGHRLGAITAGEACYRGNRQGAGLRADLPGAAGAGGARLGHRRAGRLAGGNRQEIDGRAAAFEPAVAHAPGWRIDSIGAYFAYLAHPFERRPATESPSRSPSSAACWASPASISARARKGTCASPSRTPTARPSRSFLTGSGFHAVVRRLLPPDRKNAGLVKALAARSDDREALRIPVDLGILRVHLLQRLAHDRRRWRRCAPICGRPG